MISVKQSRQLQKLAQIEASPERLEAVAELENIAKMCRSAAYEIALGGYDQEKLIEQSNLYMSLAALLRIGGRPDPELELVRA